MHCLPSGQGGPGRPAKGQRLEFPVPLSHSPPGTFPDMTQHIKVPPQGQKITVNKDNSLNVPDQPINNRYCMDGLSLKFIPA